MDMIYFDNAATSLPKPPAVGLAILEAINTFGGAGRGGHPASLAATRCIFRARKAVAELLGSTADQTVFTSNATESLNIAILGLLTPQDHVITTVLEHNSVLRPLYKLRSQGMGLSIIGIDQKGNLDYDGFYRSFRPNSKAVVCTHASNLTGTVTNLDFVADFCKKNGLLLIVDASQTAGVLSVNADKLGIDVLCFTGHKGLLGPQGTGGICVRKGLAVMPLKVGGSGFHSYSEIHPEGMPEALEAGTANGHGIAGLLAGVEYILKTDMAVIRNKELELTRLFRQGIETVAGVRIYGDATVPHAPIVTLTISSMDSGEVGDRLASNYNICVRTGAHCAPLAHVALGTQKQGAVRFSFSSFNTEEEIYKGIQAIAEIAAEGRAGIIG
ncbi:aminotransferase class V-fold PLP-dependent enzyme [Anaerospora sp.]|uniref:aminotransferase class V-fold PLP-dependent enzyme n=1 Tax=Anaerospora sp. TaxID=1960278 RepID=UPI00289ACCF0|nr:aminotransferase class V-fold PLP-dependent enzyme [Anaerospora sp.]